MNTALLLAGYLALIAYIVLAVLVAISAHDAGRGIGRALLLAMIWPAAALVALWRAQRSIPVSGEPKAPEATQRPAPWLSVGAILLLQAAGIAAIVLLVLAALPAHAADCGPRADVTGALADRYGETLRATGETDAGLMETWANGLTKSWTITITRRDMTTCLIAAGQDWLAPERPMPRPKGDAL